MKNLLTLSLLLLSSLLTAQNFRLILEGGINGSNVQDLGITLGGSAEYAFPIYRNTSLILGAGFQRLDYKKTPVENRRISCPGFCLFDFTETEIFKLTSTNLSLNIGLERRFGKWSARLVALPTYRIGAKLSADLITIPDDPNRPNTEINISVKPGEQEVSGNFGYTTIDYDKEAYLQLELATTYALTPRLSIGLAYQRMITDYEVFLVIQNCRFTRCAPFERTRFDARIGSLLTTARYSF